LTTEPGNRKLETRNSPPHVSPARAAAFDILLRVERESSYASDLLHSAAYERLSAADHALATELTMGVLRWRSLLDEAIAHASSQPLSKLDLEILLALRIALYQLRHLDRIPARAAIHESVELVKRSRKRSAAPFVNAVLRKLSATAPATPASSALEETSSSEAIARAYAHPPWLVERWATHYGLAAAQQICQYNQSVPTTAIRLRDATVETELTAEGIHLTPGALLSSARRVNAGDITQTRAFRNGRIVIQDEASQLVAALVGPGERILDCCAAPGGKTRFIADRNPNAKITAVELHPHRARLMEKMLRPVNRDSNPDHSGDIEILVADARALPTNPAFDRVLADVPCSGTGTLARNPEIKWRLQPTDLLDLQARQLAILQSAMYQVAPGGRLIYSTCSLEKEENEDVVTQALAGNNSFDVLDARTELDQLKEEKELAWPDLDSLTTGPYLRTLPGIHPSDGFFAAILKRI
jgi:16S rRNA (cytosine967-C5)-methyltransferase